MIKYKRGDKALHIPSSLGNFSGDGGASIAQIERARAEGYTAGKNAQKAKLTEITITENGIYRREDGYSKVTVATQTIPLDQITITKNGTYTPAPGHKGWNEITVKVGGEGEVFDLSFTKQYYLDPETMRIELTPEMEAFMDNNKTLEGYSAIRIPQGLTPDDGTVNMERVNRYIETLNDLASLPLNNYVRADDVVTLMKYYPRLVDWGELRYSDFAEGRINNPTPVINRCLTNDGGIFTGERWNANTSSYRWKPLPETIYHTLSYSVYVDNDTKVTKRITSGNPIYYFIQTHIDLNEYIDNYGDLKLPCNAERGIFVPLKTDRDLNLSNYKQLDVECIRYIADNLVQSTNGSTITLAPEVMAKVTNDIKAIIYSKNWNIL